MFLGIHEKNAKINKVAFYKDNWCFHAGVIYIINKATYKKMTSITGKDTYDSTQFKELFSSQFYIALPIYLHLCHPCIYWLIVRYIKHSQPHEKA